MIVCVISLLHVLVQKMHCADIDFKLSLTNMFVCFLKLCLTSSPKTLSYSKKTKQQQTVQHHHILTG